MPSPESRQIATSLRIIRIGFTGAVIGFAVLAQRLVEEGSLEADVPAGVMWWANVAVLVGALLAIFTLQRRHDREPDARKRQTLNILAWASGETAAFFGIVHWMTVGSPIPFYVGLATMLASFVLVPIRE